ncbi:hypothetical protein E4U17_005018 [Claviceps sp. LM77 group G4]|nr:hypothetical protein E4U17_005018 [Claviceps sp. LM77 group G4]KAG6082351.1 hypothetical protein E4U16_006190 [Claviceps sp. LM84 group G4]KAG6083275.1 hypothetical protein E4U33_004904 [Claviceps sp. LM78 group G4]
MAPSDEAIAFYHAVYSAVQEIPPGKVTSYGHIASLIGTPQRPRQVGLCLKYLSRQSLPGFHEGNVPWQRVVNAKGGISPRSQPQGVQDQAAALRAEGVEVTRSALGELTVDFGVYGWFPGMLPSEALDGEDEGEGEGVDEGEDVAA